MREFLRSPFTTLDIQGHKNANIDNFDEYEPQFYLELMKTDRIYSGVIGTKFLP